jgi:hypothetical protein
MFALKCRCRAWLFDIFSMFEVLVLLWQPDTPLGTIDPWNYKRVKMNFMSTGVRGHFVQ